jgi:hypothetical protein
MNVVIPRRGKPSKARRTAEHRRGFRRLVTWRTGSEGRISYLKRRYGLDRSMLDGLPGAQTWCGLGVLAHNTAKIAALMQAAGTTPTTTTWPVPTPPGRAPRPPASGRAATGPRARPRERARTAR